MAEKILVMGSGDTLLTDDGSGPYVIAALGAGVTSRTSAPIAVLDGGALGLSLLPEIATARAPIGVDAANFRGAPGEARAFDEAAMGAQLGAAKTSTHALALAATETIEVCPAPLILFSRPDGRRATAARLGEDLRAKAAPAA